MENINKSIERCIYDTPLLLLAFTKDKSIDYINNLLPYSTGIEIECGHLSNFNIEKFTTIPNIIKVNCDSNEQRFRIPNGIAGMICLYNICEQLKLNCEVNEGSGIHFHIDMTTSFYKINDIIIKDNSNWILKELSSWNYKGDYNKKIVAINGGGTWLRFQSAFKTAEFRIGEMSFDYNVLIKRIFHCQDIIKKLNNRTKPQI